LKSVILKILMFLCCSLVLGCTGKKEATGHKNHAEHEERHIYTCPMHPEIVRYAPGNCPICGMVLVEKLKDGTKAADRSLDILLKPTNQYVISQVKTTHPVEKVIPTSVMALGRITYDPRLINTVSARVSGRIEKLYVRSQYQVISKGQKLMDIYSKDLEVEQRNFLFIWKNDADNISLIQASEQKLMLLGLAVEQVEKLKTSGEISGTITIYSPYSGHLHGVAQGTDNSQMGNEVMASSATTASELPIREGMYFPKGQTIFNIYNTQRVLALLDVFPEAQGSVKAGQKITLEIDGRKDQPMEAIIDFVEPAIRENKKIITVRVYISNPGEDIQIGTLVKARFNDKKTMGLFVPSSSIVNLGLNSVVFVKLDGLFRTRRVETGDKSGDWTAIISGIKSNDVVATNGQMLMDSEGFIKMESK